MTKRNPFVSKIFIKVKEIIKTNINVSRSITVRCSKEKAFNFHADINNISKVLPPFLKLKINKLTWPFAVGAKAEIAFFLFGFLPLFVWKLKLVEFKAKSHFVDTEDSGFLKTFEHHHEFFEVEGLEEQSTIKDTIKISSGNGVLNILFDRLFLQPIVTIFLISKLNDTKRFLES